MTSAKMVMKGNPEKLLPPQKHPKQTANNNTWQTLYLSALSEFWKTVKSLHQWKD